MFLNVIRSLLHVTKMFEYVSIPEIKEQNDTGR